MNGQTQYWWTDAAQVIVSKFEQMRPLFRNPESNPIAATWFRNIMAYYSPILKSGSWETSLGFTGEQGELIEMAIPQASSLVSQLVTLVTKDRLAFECIADKSDEDTTEETRLGEALSAKIIKEQELESKKRQFVEMASVLGFSALVPIWRLDKGQPYGANDDGTIVWSGDLDIVACSPLDIVFNPTIGSWKDQPYCEFKVKRLRWNLIAMHPELTSQILALPAINSGLDDWSVSTGHPNDDMVWEYHAMHIPCPALGRGRYLRYGSSTCVFQDTINPYGCLVPEIMMPQNVFTTMMGYPFFSNLLPCQEMLDHNASAVSTVAGNLAVPTIVHGKTTGFQHEQIGGMNWVGVNMQPGVPNGGLPQVLDLCRVSPDLFKWMSDLKTHMQEISNINSAIRGEPPPGVTSGKAIATLTVNAYQFISNTENRYTVAMENCMFKAARIYRDISPIAISLEMKSGRTSVYQDEIEPQDISRVAGYQMNRTNPMLRTMSGRMTVTEDLMKMGLRDPLKYFRIMDGAPIRELYAPEQAEADLIESENRALMEGKPVKAFLGDRHAEHMAAHNSLIDNNEKRMNNPRAPGIMAHIVEHYQIATTTPLDLQMMIQTGKMPMPGEPGAPMPGGQPGGLPPSGGAPMLPAPKDSETRPANPADDALGREQLPRMEGGE